MDYRWRINLYDKIRGGDVDGIKKIPSEMFEIWEETSRKGKDRLSDHAVRQSQYLFVIQAYQVAQMCMENGMEREEALAICYHSIHRCDRAADRQHMQRVYRTMVLEYTRKMKLVGGNRDYSMNVMKTIEYISDHLGETIGVSGIADKLGLNASYLCTLFHRETGKTIGKFAKERRIEKAKELLGLPYMSYMDIASELNFCSHSHFIATFKKYTGVTPKEYREQHR